MSENLILRVFIPNGFDEEKIKNALQDYTITEIVICKNTIALLKFSNEEQGKKCKKFLRAHKIENMYWKPRWYSGRIDDRDFYYNYISKERINSEDTLRVAHFSKEILRTEKSETITKPVYEKPTKNARKQLKEMRKNSTTYSYSITGARLSKIVDGVPMMEVRWAATEEPIQNLNGRSWITIFEDNKNAPSAILNKLYTNWKACSKLKNLPDDPKEAYHKLLAEERKEQTSRAQFNTK